MIGALFGSASVRLLALLAAIVAGALAWASLRDAYITQGREQALAEVRARADERFQAGLQAGQRLASQAREEADAARLAANSLQQELARAVRNRTPMVVAQRAVADDLTQPLCAGPVAAEPNRAHAAPGLQPGPGLPAQLPPGPELHLTAAAVGLWNGALAGAQLPAGACGSASAPASACAAATSLTVEDAFSNHIENAARCRVDRTRHQRLIDYLAQRAAALSPALQE